MAKIDLKNRPPFSQNIVIRRKAIGWSQADLAHKVGVHVNIIKGIETGKSEGATATRQAIAQALSCSMSDLYQTEAANMRTKIKMQLDSQSPSEKQMGDFVFEVLEENKSLRSKLEAARLSEAPVNEESELISLFRSIPEERDRKSLLKTIRHLVGDQTKVGARGK